MKDYHEPLERLSEDTADCIRALSSLKEEIEAIDWYQQRIDTCSDVSLRKILEHNRNEEMEHACMVLEWLRRNQEGWNGQLREYLFTEDEIVG
jgi:ferritin-like protein